MVESYGITDPTLEEVGLSWKSLSSVVVLWDHNAGTYLNENYSNDCKFEDIKHVSYVDRIYIKREIKRVLS